MPQIKRVEINITADNVWFLQRNLGVFDFVEIFPADAIAADGERGNPIVLHTDRGFDIESDITRTGLQLRNRSKLRGWVRWTDEHRLNVGDHIIIERMGDRDYRLALERVASGENRNHEQIQPE